MSSYGHYRDDGLSWQEAAEAAWGINKGNTIPAVEPAPAPVECQKAPSLADFGKRWLTGMGEAAPSAEDIFSMEVLATLAGPLNELTVQVRELEDKVQQLQKQLNTPVPTPQIQKLTPRYTYIRSINNPFDKTS